MIYSYRTEPYDDVQSTRAKFVGLLSEKLATHRLALTKAIEAGDRRRIKAEIEGLAKAIELARGEMKTT